MKSYTGVLLFAAAMVPIFALRFRGYFGSPKIVRNLTAAAASPKEIAETAIKSNKIMVFSKTYCPYCKKAKDAIANLQVKYNVYELDEMKNGDEIQNALLEMTGQRTVPNIFVNGKHVGGCDNTMAAIQSGEFQKMLKA